ncbi:pilus assembly protein TadG [Rhizobium sp. Leaf384]|uniref:TadE/TadG family type IV pilus assembly protein n=1 Tax=unclassified Rhizobium TaxID=2613769 RepID=UPI00071503C2|nr:MULTISPECIES: TadE/TadG family type IV pilus assembly protein [unclassified Rhizobium]KQR71658.1 pilus assembly protein TadG [Rhizobium sp. Leaf341]KQS75356.1 pilus assembly protein TadG [Rhizobium sp. Leaf383]KQS78728.1 pilus assembly protein TadG [Rhizobium sp. Leaf384]
MMARRATRFIRRFFADRTGVAAIEFALVALPLFVILFGIIEVSLMFFVDASLDASVRKVSRTIRTGQVAAAAVSLGDFKSKICGEMSLLFNCTDNLLVRVAVVSDLASIAAADPIGPGGTLAVNESFNPGRTSDYVLVQAFLPWTAISFFSLSNARLADGRYLLGSAVLFRNEPF